MRFWSLNTVLSTFAQGMVFHSYIGSCTVLMTCILLLVPLSSSKPGIRQHIRRITRQRWLLTPSYLVMAYGLTACSIGESHGEVSSFLMTVLRSLRTVLCAGFSGSELWS